MKFKNLKQYRYMQTLYNPKNLSQRLFLLIQVLLKMMFIDIKF
jgi:hypothetical protein